MIHQGKGWTLEVTPGEVIGHVTVTHCKCCDAKLLPSDKYDVCAGCYRAPGGGCSKCGVVLEGICYEYVCGGCIGAG